MESVALIDCTSDYRSNKEEEKDRSGYCNIAYLCEMQHKETAA
jgi:hypothetical protein